MYRVEHEPTNPVELAKSDIAVAHVETDLSVNLSAEHQKIIKLNNVARDLGFVDQEYFVYTPPTCLVVPSPSASEKCFKLDKDIAFEGLFKLYAHARLGNEALRQYLTFQDVILLPDRDEIPEYHQLLVPLSENIIIHTND